MAKSKNNTALSLVTEGTDSVGILGVLKNELSKLTAVSQTPFKTSGAIEINKMSVDISTETKIPHLIMIVAAVESGEAAYTKAAEGALASSLKGSYPVYKVNGYSKDAIIHDCNLKIEVISYSERKKELEELVKEAEGFLTKQDQFKIFQQKLQSKLGSSTSLEA